MRCKALRLAVLVAFAAGGLACGAMEMPMTLALEEGSGMSIYLNPTTTPLLLGDVQLEGGVETLMTTQIDLMDLLWHRPIMGTIEITKLLFAGTPFSLLGIPTGAVCTVPDPNTPSGGTVLIDLFDHKINNASVQFVMDMATAIKVENPVLAGAIPDGFPLVLTVDSEADLSLAEMLGMFLGTGGGGFGITQELDEVFTVSVMGLPLELGVVGQLTLNTVDEFPTGALLDDCIALLGL